MFFSELSLEVSLNSDFGCCSGGRRVLHWQTKPQVPSPASHHGHTLDAVLSVKFFCDIVFSIKLARALLGVITVGVSPRGTFPPL